MLTKEQREAIMFCRNHTLQVVDTSDVYNDLDEIARLVKGHPYIRKVILPKYVPDFYHKLFDRIFEKSIPYRLAKMPSVMNDRISLFSSRVEALQASSEIIMQHAKRRVDLLFYTLLRYYNSKQEIYLASTDRDTQKVSGYISLDGIPIYITHACHSALISNPQSYFFNKDIHNNIRTLIEIVWSDQNDFFNNLSITHELPREVNGFDSALEESSSYGRKFAIWLINAVSKGTYDPKQGLQLFLLNMQEFFKSQINNYYNSPYLEKRLIYYFQYQGTFIGKWDFNKNDIADTYLCRLLHLQENELQRFKLDEEFRKSTYNSNLEDILLETTDPKNRTPKPQFAF